MYDVAQFSLGDMTACGSAVRKLGRDATTMEETASRIARYFYNNCNCQRSVSSGQACAPVLVFIYDAE